MSIWFIFALIVCTAFVSWVGVGKLIGVLLNRQMVDRPNERSLHKGVVPRGGGLIIMVLLGLATLVLALLTEQNVFYATVFLYLLCWSLLGWTDDRLDLSAGLRFFAQAVFAGLLIYMFGYVDEIVLSQEIVVHLGLFGIAASLIGIVWLANLYNFMDGMDGLTASQTIIAAITLSVWFYQLGHDGLFYLCVILASSTYGFLLWNWHPAKIFMGDVGSIGIGAFFALLIIVGVTQYEIPVLSFVILLSAYIYDASYTLFARLLRREKIWEAHRSHHYQRLASLGFAHQKIVLCMITIMLISSLIASITVQYHDIVWLGMVFIMVVLVLCSMILNHLEARSLDAKSSEK